MKHLTLIILISSCTIILLPSVFGGWESCIKNAANCWAKYLERTLNKPGPLSEYLPSEYFYCCYIYDAFDCAKHVSGTDCSITLPFNGQNATKQNTSLRAADGCPNYEGSVCEVKID